MASTSSNSITQSSNSSSSLRRNYYDVFITFRGKDTRYNFTDQLFAALQRKGIFAFRDDTNLPKSESIAPELLRAIQVSQIFVVVFSKNYASSTWCLRELEYILLHCRQQTTKHILPVFYDVDPSEVRYQKEGDYEKAFVKHEQRFQQDYNMVQRWREALTQVANLSGWDIHDKPQYAQIEKIVKEIINILSYNFSSLPKDLVGMDSPIEELEKCLLLDSIDDVRVVGISGMGGIGKTTLATVLYNKISHQFPVYCRIADLSKIYRHDGPIGAQKQILLQTLGEEYLQTCNLHNTSNLIQSRLCREKALIIIDNVDQVEQLEKLAVSREWLGEGSRVVIISRDEHILKEYGVDVVYKVPLLNKSDSLQFFCRKAFKLDHIMSSYDKLAFDILRYANGLPLAIKVLGSFLFGRNIPEWESALATLRESPNEDIMDVLRLSFDGLEKMQKEIFLHVACFFNGCKEKYVKNVLNCCGFHPDIGLRVLIDKSLIIISVSNKIEIHGLLEELGRKIVQENSINESRKWSRVWIYEQFYNVMLENMEKKVEAVCFVREGKKKEILIKDETLSKISQLRLLILKGVTFSGNIACLSNELRYLEWDRYPFKYLPSSFHPNQLVELNLRNSNVKQLWKDKKYLPNLRILDLGHSKNLRKMPDFGKIPNLEVLDLEGCVKLEQMDPSIGVLRKLVFLNLKYCKNLASIPNNIFGMSSIKCLYLPGCPKVFKNPWQLKKLNSSEISSHSLYHKDLTGCLRPSLLSLYCLREVNVSFCGLSQLPDAIGCLHWLEGLDLGGNNFVTVPSLRELSKLVYLNLEHCKLLESLPELPFHTANIDHNLHINIYENIKGLVIFNCPKLGEREPCSIMAFSWMIQFIQAIQESSTSVDWIDIVIPKSEIPSWCNNQSEGNSIRIDSSLVSYDNNNHIIGIACCSVFSVAPGNPTTATNAKRTQIRLNFTNCNTHWWWDGIVPVILERDHVAVKSDHMCLMYFPLESFVNILKFVDKTLMHLDMKVIIIKNNKGLDLEVQSCGYRWIYKQDLQLMHASLQKFRSSEVQVFGN